MAATPFAVIAGSPRQAAAKPARAVRMAMMREGSEAVDGADVTMAGHAFVADISGVLYWPAERLLAVADMHLEKGSSFARRGMLLPPYDSAATLARLSAAIARYEPRTVIALGDNFHDGDGAGRLSSADRATLAQMQKGRQWIWIAGNHDPDPAAGIGGVFCDHFAVGPIVFRHEPGGEGCGEIAGHLHPVARVGSRGRAVRARCFASDGTRLVMPAFGAYTGGLNVRDRAFANVFPTLSFTAHLIGRKRIYAVAGERCLME